ncbi:basic helix-loop-helix (bHLH) DNA-binding superfamily protein [Wolffia australiana]
MMEVAAEERRRGGYVAAEKRLKTSCGGRGGSAKERKDRFGEQVAALQQLVSPFGKTDTASVLQDTHSYIQFLHEQLQVLSTPYLRSKTPADQTQEGEMTLRSRGLCLVPVAKTLAIARSNGADIWAPPGAP